MAHQSQFPDDFVNGYWEAVADELVRRGMGEPDAAAAIGGYRAYMSDAADTIYNDSTTASARYAKRWFENRLNAAKKGQVSDTFAALYWQAVTAQLCKGGMSETDAGLAIEQYRERMKRAGDTIYNDQTSETAKWAKKLFVPLTENPKTAGTAKMERAAPESKGSKPSIQDTPPTRVTRLEDELKAVNVVGAFGKEWKQSDKIGLLVVTPTGAPELAPGIVDSMSARAGGPIPTIAVSLPFQNRDPFNRLGLPFPPTVYCDSKDGGKQLAKAAREDFKRRWPSVPRPNVVLIPGEANRSDSDDRLNSFREELADLNPVVTTLDPCRWQRDPAKEAMLEHIRRAKAKLDDARAGAKPPRGDKSKRPAADDEFGPARNPEFEVHIVLAACDEMALGARDAVRAGPAEVAGRALVYGYDAVSEVTALIDERDLNMMGTMLQSSEKMAMGLVEMIHRVQTAPPGTTPADIVIRPDIVRPKRDETFKEVLARILPINHSSGQWLTVAETVDYTGLTRCTLKDYTKKGRASEVENLLGYHCGRDALGRIWCQKVHGPVYWWRDSLVKKKP